MTIEELIKLAKKNNIELSPIQYPFLQSKNNFFEMIFGPISQDILERRNWWEYV